jgi:hypothetical protein
VSGRSTSDLVEPDRKRAPAAILAEPTQSDDHRFLSDIVRFIRIRRKCKGPSMHAWMKSAHQLAECVEVAAARLFDERIDRKRFRVGGKR